MSKQIDKSVDINEIVKEYFVGRAMAKAKSTAIRVSSKLVGFDANLKPVRQFTNRGESVFVIFEDYQYVIGDKPEMTTEF